MQGAADRPPPRLLVIETSHRIGVVALADGARILGERRLDEARRHARDLVPAIQALLAEQQWRARDLDGVVVSRGPGSYTGLRVGVMSAKTLAYATGCTLLGIDTFAAIARQAPPDRLVVDVIADAQKDKLYVQRYARSVATTPLIIQSFETWRATLTESSYVIGPGLEKVGEHLPAHIHTAPPEIRFSAACSLLAIALERLARGERDDPFAIEPLYLRPSSAEEQWNKAGKDTPP